MNATHQTTEVTAEQVMSLHEWTGRPIMECKQYLSSISVTDRNRVLESLRAGKERGESFFRDPIEFDPNVRPKFEEICKEAGEIVREWQQERVRRLQLESPELAKAASTGTGLCHRHWALVKQLMRERHGIEWRSPSDMNPGVLFD
jgi:hypothetical protein